MCEVQGSDQPSEQQQRGQLEADEVDAEESLPDLFGRDEGVAVSTGVEIASV